MLKTQTVENVDYFDAHGDHAVTRIKLENRKSLYDITMVSVGCSICMSGLFTGAAMAAGLNLKQAIIATLLGNLILTVYGGLIGIAGTREGVGTAVLSRHAFGRGGSKMVGTILAVTMLGWYSVQVGFFGETVFSMYPNGGIWTHPRVAAFWGGMLMMISAYAGYRGLSLLSKIAVPAILVIAVIGIAAVVKKYDGIGQIFLLLPQKPMGIGAGIVIVVGSFACGASAQSDITRYAKSAKDAFLSCFMGLAIANSFVILSGAITSYATGNGDLPASILALGMGIPSLIFLIAGQWTTNDNNLYMASLGLSNVCRASQKKIVMIGGIIATIVGSAGLYAYFVHWLILLGVTIPPVAGIIITDYYFLNRAQYRFGPGTKYASIGWTAFVAWLCASVFGYLFSWGNPSLNSLISAGAIYYLLSVLFKSFQFKAATGEYEEDTTGF